MKSRSFVRRPTVRRAVVRSPAFRRKSASPQSQQPPKGGTTNISFLLVWALACLAPTCSLRAEPVDYLRDVKPIFKRKCYSCHGALKQESDLRLDTLAHMRAGGYSGAAVEPGDPAASLILQRITAGEAERMPPEGEPLTAEQIDLIRQWIAGGANGPTGERAQSDPTAHWAFQPLKPAEAPCDGNDYASAIDTFIRQRLNDAGLQPSPPAGARLLIRRLFLDMHGLPPTPEELGKWTLKLAPDANKANPGQSKSIWEEGVRELVDYLLASPRYGERWAQHWLDIVRYADTHGYEVNTPRPNAWPYRDYVIGAFNDDKPYDRFVSE